MLFFLRDTEYSKNVNNDFTENKSIRQNLRL